MIIREHNPHNVRLVETNLSHNFFNCHKKNFT